MSDIYFGFVFTGKYAFVVPKNGRKTEFHVCISVLSTNIWKLLPAFGYTDSLKTIICNDGMDSHGDERRTVTQMAGDEVDQGTWGMVMVPGSYPRLYSQARAI